MHHLLITAAALFATSFPTPTVDIVPAGYKGVACTMTVAIAPAARQTSIVGYRIVEGDTLSKIAESELGAAGRAADIVALNPGIDPKALEIDSVILLPPLSTDVEDADVVCLFTRGQLHWSNTPFVPGEDCGDHYGARIVAVPKARLAEYVALIERTDSPGRDLLDEADWVKSTDGFHRIRNVKQLSKTAKIERVFRVTSIHEGAPQLEHVEDRHFDSDGERVDAAATHKAELVVLVLLVVAGLGGLAWLVRRRRRSPTVTDDRHAQAA